METNKQCENNQTGIHRTQFSFKQVMRDKQVYYCRDCGLALVADKTSKIIHKAFQFILLGFVLFQLLFNKVPEGDKKASLIRIGTFFAALLVYIFLEYLLCRFGRFIIDETLPAQKIVSVKEEQVSPAKEAKKIIKTAKKSTGCEHDPQMDWKLFIPGTNKFYCKKCKKTIDMDKSQANFVNIILLMLMLFILFPVMIDLSKSWTEYTIRMLIMIAAAEVVQLISIFLLRKKYLS